MLKLAESRSKLDPKFDLEVIAREGARRMLVAALDAEVSVYLTRHQERDEDGRALVVRNGKSRARKVTMGSGTVEIQAPRINDKRVDARGVRQRFTSQILPPYMRRSPKVAEVLPILYLRGLSTGDFREALPVLLGDDASGLFVNEHGPTDERLGEGVSGLFAAGPERSRLRVRLGRRDPF